MSNRASYQRLNPNLRCGASKASTGNFIKGIGVYLPQNPQSPSERLEMTASNIRKIAAMNPELNVVSLAVAIASGKPTAITYKNRSATIKGLA